MIQKIITLEASSETISLPLTWNKRSVVNTFSPRTLLKKRLGTKAATCWKMAPKGSPIKRQSVCGFEPHTTTYNLLGLLNFVPKWKKFCEWFTVWLPICGWKKKLGGRLTWNVYIVVQQYKNVGLKLYYSITTISQKKHMLFCELSNPLFLKLSCLIQNAKYFGRY